MTRVADLCWPVSRLGEGVELLARAAGLPCGAGRPSHASASPSADPGPALETAAAGLGLQTDSVDVTFREIDAFLRAAGPAVIRHSDDQAILLVRRRSGSVAVLAPDGRIRSVSIGALRAAIVDPEAAPLVADADRLAAEAGVPERSRAKVAKALVNDRLRTRRVRGAWLLRVPSSAPFVPQAVGAGARRTLVRLALAHAFQYGIWIAAWWLLGRSALEGRLDASWLTAWALALASLVPLQLAALWLQGRLAIAIGALLKQRLLTGAFALEPEHIRREGAGHLLGRVIEAEAVESLALGGGFMALLAALELLIAACVMAIASPLLAVLLVGWTLVAALLTWIFFRRRLAWVRLRIGLTLDLIEGMIGHRTRVAQLPRADWHRGEDEALERYVHSSSAMDRAAVALVAVVPRGWMLVGLCGLAPAFVAAQAGDAAALAVGLGGLLLGFKAFHRLTAGVWSLAGAAIAWQQTSPVFAAAGTRTIAPTPAIPSAASGPAAVVLEATDLRFTHAGRQQAVLRGCTLSLTAGDRVILQGPSGGGKSTLASILAGLRTPQAGLLLADGLDRQTLGLDGWRRRIVLVPQFHENHLALGSLAFNLLMGTEWPAGEEEFSRAEGVLRELGLGPTLDRMPSGLLQTVGETGWQLSHGERSRVYLARALLQQPDVLILDESFAQLDPENMHLALDAVAARRSAVLLVAHP